MAELSSTQQFEDRALKYGFFYREPQWRHVPTRNVHDPGVLKFQDVRILEELASGLNGIVYLIGDKTSHFVLKIIDPLRPNYYGQDECHLTVKLGEEVRRDLDLPFLITYGHGSITKKGTMWTTKDSSEKRFSPLPSQHATFFHKCRAAKSLENGTYKYFFIF